MSYREMFCAHRYDMSTPVGLPDLAGGNPGTGANIASNPPGIGSGRCAEFNGNNSNYNLGDITMLNAVSAFSIAFWMNQDVLDVTDHVFVKGAVAGTRLRIFTSVNGNIYFEIGGNVDRGFFDYSASVDAGRWHHVVGVYDGSQAANAGRLVVYMDSAPVTLTFNGTIPAATNDLGGADAYIGYTGDGFDGLLDDFRFYSIPLTNLQVSDLREASRQGRSG